MDPAPGLAFAADGLTAAAGIANTAWLWRRLGFDETGEIHHGQLQMRLVFSESP